MRKLLSETHHRIKIDSSSMSELFEGGFDGTAALSAKSIVAKPVAETAEKPKHGIASVLNSSGNSRNNLAYLAFEKTVAGRGMIEAPECFYSKNADGENILQPEGVDYQKHQRILNALPVLPSCIYEAQQRFTFIHGCLQRRLAALIRSSGLDIKANLAIYDIGWYNCWGTFSVRGDSQTAAAAIRLIGSQKGAEINVLAEETAICGALVAVAAKDEQFRREYDSDPAAAAHRHYAALADVMLKIALPSAEHD